VGTGRGPDPRVPEPVVVGQMSTPALPIRGSCYGYAVHSDLELKYLRSGAGDPLEVVTGLPPDRPHGELLREWAPPDFPVHARLFADGDGFRLWNDEAGWYCIDPHAPRIIVPREGDPVRREERIWGLPIMLCFLARGELALHASCVEVDGRALILAAPRRFGKTTLAAAFAAAGYRVLAEDLTCLRLSPSPSVIPGPAMLRVRRDVADSFIVPGAVELGRDEDRVHLSLDHARGSCDPVALGGIALLLEGDTDPLVEPAEGTDVLRDLWLLSFKLRNDDDMARCFNAVTQAAFAAPAWNLTRRLELQDLPATVERLADAMGSVG